MHQIPSLSDSERSRDGRSRVSRIVTVVFALFAFWKARNAALFPQSGKSVHATAQKLIGITLMSHIENNFILGKIEYVKQRDGRFHRTEIRRKMSAAFGDGIVYNVSQFVAKDVELAFRTTFDVFRTPTFQHYPSSSLVYFRMSAAAHLLRLRT